MNRHPVVPTSPTIGETSLPREPPLADISCFLLEFLRATAKSILQANNHPVQRASQELPVETLSSILSDGVVLYEFFARVAPEFNQPYSIQHYRRHTPSSPIPYGPDPDADALARIYKGNTRRLLQVLPGVLDNVREYVAYPPPRINAPIKNYVGRVEDIPPSRDPLPVTRLAMLVVAVAVYGPSKDDYLPHVLSLSPDLMTPFRMAMARVAYEISLPHPDKLLTASIPRPHPSVHRTHSGSSSPAGYMSPGAPPIQRAFVPHSPHFPGARTPGHATPPPGILPHLFMSPPTSVQHSLPGSPLPIHTPPMARSPRQQHYPRHPHQSRRAPRHITDTSPRSRGSVGTSPVHRPPPSPARSGASESVASSDSRRAHHRNQSKDLERSRPSRSNPTIPSPLVSVNKPKNPDTFASPLQQPGPNTSQFSFGSDDGIGARKYSLVTNESSTGSTRGSGSPPKLDEFGHRVSSSSTTSRVMPQSNVAEEMRKLEEEQKERQRALVAQAAAKARSGSTTSMSEEFYTPREDTLSPDVEIGPNQPGPVSHQTQSDLPEEGTGRLSDSAPAVYSQEDLKNMVRQSVTTSVTHHISVPPVPVRSHEKENTQHRNTNPVAQGSSSLEPTPRGVKNPKLFRGDSVASSVGGGTSTYLQSPAPSDIPSPSTRWQVSGQRSIVENILSPETIFSPPSMPARNITSASATQTSPREAPPLFSQNTESPQMSLSSAGVFSMAELLDQQKNSKVSFAGKITTPGGGERPLKDEEEEEEEPVHRDHEASSSTRFSLPPSAARRDMMQHDDDDHGNEEQEEFESHHSEVESEDERSDIEQPDPDTEERDADWNFPGEESSSAPIGEEEIYHTDNEDPRPPEEVFSGEDMPFSPDQPPSMEYQTVSEHSIIEDEKDDDRMKKDEDKASLRDQGVGSTARSAADSETGRGKAASSHREGYSRKKPPVPPGHSPAVIPYSTSTPTYHRRTPTNRDVPPTPPTPPPIETLLESIRPGRNRDSSSKAPRPISTMAPSGELFQRLINIVQESGEVDADRFDHEMQRYSEMEPQPHNPGQGPPSHSSTHESTLPSGDTDADMEKVTGTSRRRGQRPRAVRMASGPLGLSGKLGIRHEDTKVETFEEQTSVASFSDAFSEEKDRHWSYESQGMEGQTNEWEEAMQGDGEAGIPFSPPTNEDNDEESNVFSPEYNPRPSTERNIPEEERFGAHSIYSKRAGVSSDGVHIKVDRRRLDWLTKEVLSARDAVARKELQMTAAEMQHREQEEILTLEKQDAQCLVNSMKRVLYERETELQQARQRLSVAIQNVSNQDAASQTSRSASISDTEKLSKLITEGNEKLHDQILKSESNAVQEFTGEMRSLFGEVQRAMIERMLEMTEKRDEELQLLRTELTNRERMVRELKKSGDDLRTENKAYQAKAAEIALEKEESAKNYELEMGHVTAQVELVNEFSKKLHDNFRETENLRRQVLQYQEKLSHITSASGISQRQIKELREAVTRANDECARLRREADVAKRRGMEAVRRAEELEDLRYKEAALSSPRTYPDRQDRTDSGSLQSQPVRPPGQNRPGGMGVNARYHAASRSRGGSRSNKAPIALNAFLEKIFRKDASPSRRRGHGQGPYRHKEPSRAGSASQSSRSDGRSYRSPRDPVRSRTHSVASRTSNGSGSSLRSGSQRSDIRMNQEIRETLI